jgi:hypothetical protein
MNRSLVSYTGEDTEQTTLNLPLVKSLREPIKLTGNSGVTPSEPPNFYDEDIRNFQSKFDQVVK